MKKLSTAAAAELGRRGGKSGGRPRIIFLGEHDFGNIPAGLYTRKMVSDLKKQYRDNPVVMHHIHDAERGD